MGNIRNSLWCSAAAVLAATPVVTQAASGSDRENDGKFLSDTAIVPIPPSKFAELARTSQKLIAERKYDLPAISGDNIDKLQTLCASSPTGNPVVQESAIAFAFLADVLKPIFKFLFGKADKALDRKIAQYKAEWTAGGSYPLFSFTNGAVQPTVRCIRIARASYQKDQSGPAQIEFDTLFFVHWIPDSSAWQLIPIHTYTRHPQARGSKVTYAMSLAGSAPYVDDGVGKMATIPETVIAKGAYNIREDRVRGGLPKQSSPVPVCLLLENFVQFEGSFDAAGCAEPGNVIPSSAYPGAAVLAVPGALPTASGPSTVTANLTFKMAEAGTGRRKGRLEDWKLFISKGGDDVSGALETAVDELLKPDDD